MREKEGECVLLCHLERDLESTGSCVCVRVFYLDSICIDLERHLESARVFRRVVFSLEEDLESARVLGKALREHWEAQGVCFFFFFGGAGCSTRLERRTVRDPP